MEQYKRDIATPTSEQKTYNLILDFLLYGAPLDEIYIYNNSIKQDLLNYFNKPSQFINKKSEKEIIYDLNKNLKNYIENLIRQKTGKIGILLSGGIDSANILSHLVSNNQDIFAYTWGGWGIETMDVIYSKFSVKKFGILKQKIISLDHNYENQIKLFIEAMKMVKLPLSFSNCIPYLRMVDEIKKDGISYIFNGQNADTLFMSYPAPVLTFQCLKIFNFLGLDKFFSFLNPIIFMSRFKSLGTSKYIKMTDDYKTRLNSFWKPINKLPTTFQQKIVIMEEIYTEARTCQNHQKEFLEAHGLEVLNPYYDLDFIKYTISLPDYWRKKDNYKKYLLYKLAKNNGVPKEVIEKPKKGLSYGYTNFIENKHHLKIWEEILDNKILSKYVDVRSAFEHERDNFFLFNRLMSAHYFIKYVLK